MVVQHNISAMNANRMLGVTTRTLASSTEKLSSGYKINRAADNAAGLSISEKMRRQIRGLTQASLNAEDGISAVQTAEGALQEVTDMLQRMNELSVQAANGTNSVSDRSFIQDEMDQLIGEIDRVSETTKFNEIYILKGDKNKGTTMVNRYNYIKTSVINEGKNSADVEKKINLNSNANLYFTDKDVLESNESAPHSAVIKVKGDDVTKYLSEGETGSNYDVVSIDIDEEYVAFQNAALPAQKLTADDGIIFSDEDTYLFDTKTSNIIRITAGLDITEYLDSYEVADPSGIGMLKNVVLDERYRGLKAVGGATLGAGGSTCGEDAIGIDSFKGAVDYRQLYDADGQEVSAITLGKYFNDKGMYQGGLYTDKIATKEVSADASSDQYYGNYITIGQAEVNHSLSFELQVGNDSDRSNRIETTVEAFSADALGLTNLKSIYSGIVDTTGDKARDTIDVIADALKKVSTQRSTLGAMQNRLEHTIKNLENVVENTTAAESAIRDTDMATEMVRFSNTNIIAQAGQSMLAQANQSKQGVLSLIGQ